MRRIAPFVISVVFLFLQGCSGIIGYNREAISSQPEAATWHLRPSVKNRNCFIGGGQRGLEVSAADTRMLLEQHLEAQQIRLHTRPVEDVPLAQLLLVQSCVRRTSAEPETAMQELRVWVSDLGGPLLLRDIYLLEAEVWLEGQQLRQYRIEVPYQEFFSLWTATTQLFLSAEERQQLKAEKGQALVSEGLRRLVTLLQQDESLSLLLKG